MASLGWINQINNSTGGAIVGAIPNPWSYVWFNGGGTGYMTSGTLSAGDPGELGGLTDATIEFWYAVDAAPSALRSLIIGPESSAAVRQWGFELNTNRTVRFYVRNASSSLFLLTSTTALSPSAGIPNVWYHIAGAVDSTAGLIRLYINGVQETSAAWGAGNAIHASSLSTTAGDLRVNDSTNDVTMYYDELATYRRFIGANRISAHYTAGTARGFALVKPGERMGNVLDKSASVHAPRSIQAGTRFVTESYMAAQAPLGELQKARAADNVDAMLFVSKSGSITFLADGHRSTAPYNSVQATFGDAGGSELAYLTLELDYSDAFLTNEWNVTREQGFKNPISTDKGETQTVADATSVSRYYRRPQSLSDVPVSHDADAATIATELLAKTKDPMLRVTSIELSTLDPNVADAALALELGDRVRVLRTPPGGGARIDQTLFVQKVEVAGANDGAPWSIRFGVSPL